jgi:hypothetical protein
MIYKGHIENGVVVFAEPIPLAPGTEVRVEAVAPAGADFWEPCSLEELARRQGVPVPESPEEMVGGWPDDELHDGFEEAVALWRERELEQVEMS